MPALSKFTTTYSESEDRLRLAGESADGVASATLWLTQRLMNRLVAAITQWLEADARAQAPYSLDARLHNAFAQEAATRQLEPSAPVAVRPESPPLLVTSVNLRREDDLYVVVFLVAGDTSAPAFIRFSSTGLRQWLGIVHGLYHAADWPLAVWPEWFDRKGDAVPQVAVLH